MHASTKPSHTPNPLRSCQQMMTLYEDFGKPPSKTRDLSREEAVALIQSLSAEKADAALDIQDNGAHAATPDANSGSPTGATSQQSPPKTPNAAGSATRGRVPKTKNE
jgi:hypothetical protein